MTPDVISVARETFVLGVFSGAGLLHQVSDYKARPAASTRCSATPRGWRRDTARRRAARRAT